MKKSLKLVLGILAIGICATSCQEKTETAVKPEIAVNTDDYDRSVLPIVKPKRPFYTELDVRDVKAPPRFEVKAPKGAPNVVIVLIDDMGFGVTNTFGGPIEMPVLDKLADNGLRYNRFHTTALCAPTRSALMTGYNHHSVNMGSITETATSFPGNDAIRPQSITPMPEVLLQNGYNTAMFGKCHGVPPWELSVSGPQTQWPAHSGFEKFYGFLGGETNQWAPLIYDGVTMMETPKDPDYHFTIDMTNQAISWVRFQQAMTPEKPFMMYYAPGATHAPHHTPQEWIDKNKGKFDAGWDVMRQETFERQKALGIIPQDAKLAPKPKDIKDWDDLTDKEKKLFARQMEVYAGFAQQTDFEIGRLKAAIEDLGVMDNTVFIYIAGDNGTSAEGGMNGMFNEMTYFNQVPETVDDMLEHYDEWGSPSTYPHMAAGWAVALDAPFTWTKQMASDFGGTRNGMVIHYPKGITKTGEIREQFSHVNDIAPTVYEIVGVPAPKVVNGIKQNPIEGTSLVYTFNEKDAEEQHKVQYFEMFGNRGIYSDGWLARVIHKAPWQAKPIRSLQDDIWELYNEQEDFTLTNNIADKHPEKLKELQDLFMKEAEKYHVLPIDDRVFIRMDAAAVGRPTLMDGRKHLVLGEGMRGMAPDVFINTHNVSFSITADVEVDDNGNGVLVCQGGRFGGFSLYIKNGIPAFTYNFLGLESYNVKATEKLKSGKHKIVMDFKYDGGGRGKGGTATISVDGKKSAESRVDKTQMTIFSVDDMADVGIDEGTQVADYGITNRFNGKIDKIIIDVK
ncbi:arylsulfatase [Xanthomarina spongicola]|uniref:Arylsulfatase n=1 Tax=Xanthomarina spongicola TaxID=570520 RepID=A0A316DTV8_9FLAO|nr:arylsulfatase [Xanthomarina spongicola]PWK20862.1 arylsulfatase [Xanthomarina spongicola]